MTRRVRLVIAGTVLIAATILVVAGNDVSDTPLAGALASWVALIVISVAAVALGASWRRWSMAIRAAAGLYIWVCVALATFHIGAPVGLDLDFALASPADSIKTTVRMVGWPATILGVLLLAGTVTILAAAVAAPARLLTETPRARRLIWPALVGGIVTLAVLGLPHDYLRTPAHRRSGESIRPVVAEFPPLPRTGDESVYLVQLESVNGLIAEDGYTARGQRMPVDPMTGMRRVARKGIFFPYFLAGSVTTHRAQETILCGAVRNVHAPYFDQLVPWDGQCLPAMMRDAGYQTVFLSSFVDRAFGATGDFMERAGFNDVHFADFMKPGDAVTRWGYDEQIFFTRAFEYLRSRYKKDDKLFVYMAVCAHHFGFTRDPNATDMANLIGTEVRRGEQYLWSQRIQDQSLLTFDRLHEDFTGGAAHTFYVPDHSFPLGLYGGTSPSMGATVDNFVTPFVYVPPKTRAAEFAVGRTVADTYAQTDIMPTIAELVSGTPYPNSLVPILRRTPSLRADYEQCHVLTQPYAGRWLVVVRGDRAYQYHVATQILREYRLTARPLRQEKVRTVEGMTYEEFERRFGCRRYRPGSRVTLSERTP